MIRFAIALAIAVLSLGGARSTPAAEDAPLVANDVTAPAKTPEPEAALEPGAPSDPLRLLQSISQRMEQVGTRIESRDTSLATTQSQDQIVSDLQALVDAAGKQDSSHSTAAQSTAPGSAPPDGQGSGEPTGAQPGGSPDSTTDESRAGLNAVWGELPARLRERIQSPLREEFLPGYETLIRDYYKRLARRQRERGGNP